MNKTDNLVVNTIRLLSAEAIQKANSGHPGLPMGAAPMAYELWAKHLKMNPKNPKWLDRDRFILSGGHGSMLLYSLLHLFEYGLTMEDLQNFRQWGSLTPGHPEYGHTVGVETTTGPLGAGIANAVGMAMAERHLASRFNKDGFDIVDHYTYVLGGDGCMMEGISYEAASLAGTLKLDKLIVLYDSNNISIEGSTDLAFTEHVRGRFEALGFQTYFVEDGNDLNAISEAIKQAKENKGKPSFVEVKTQIGYGCPAKQGKASAHGEPLGKENIVATREYLQWTEEGEFVVPSEVREYMAALVNEKAKTETAWNQTFEEYTKAYPELAKEWEQIHSDELPVDLLNNEEFWSFDDKANATRNISGEMINRLKNILPNLMGGSADLAPSTKTYMSGAGDFSAEDYSGRNLHFGVRELAMAGIGNGLAVHGGLKPYVSTFFVFSDYVKPMARLSALMGLPLIYVFTHDSIGVGEDGPTHEPIEQLTMLRSMPNFTVYRPADATETAAAWYYAVSSKNTPTAIVLTRQNLPQYKESSKEALKGGYILKDSVKEVPDAILMASGSEVELAYKAQAELLTRGVDVRVVSIPSMDVFDAQSVEYKEKVLPHAVRKRVAIEAGSSLSWGKYVGLEGTTVTIDHFGASAPADILFREFGFTVDNVINKTMELMK